MYILTLDTETLGLPIYDNGSYADYKSLKFYDPARILQTSWCLIDHTDTIISEKDYLVKNNFNIQNSHIHGITSELCNQKGVDFSLIVDTLLKDCQDLRLYVGHNCYFDLNILKSELYRYSLENTEYTQKCLELIQILEKVEVFDTMFQGQYRYKLSKWPKLVELHKLIFGTELVGAHNALNDVKATLKIFLFLVYGSTLKEKNIEKSIDLK